MLSNGEGRMRGITSRVVRAAIIAAAAIAVAGCWLPSTASAVLVAPVGPTDTGSQLAFYTYQAPGGADTAGKRVIALTFDDGPGPYTPQVLSILERYSVPATFFEVGEEIAAYPQYTRALTAAGYPVENHTWSHADLTTLSASGFAFQVDQTQNEVRSVTGQTPSCVRPPYNAWNSTVLAQDALRGLTTMSYSIDPRDWSLPGTQAIVSRVVSAAFPGGVVDMHDAGGPRDETVAALPQIISDLQSQGYTFVAICAPGQSVGPQRSAVYSFGDAPAPGPSVVSNDPLVGAADNPQGSGFWLSAADGGVFAFGTARYYGSTGNVRLTQPVVGMAPTRDGGGYWLVAADGGIFAFGNARYYG
jgi:peptidoglycan/xylan/chitin deacetylase (PgdA/CDA1 family)